MGHIKGHHFPQPGDFLAQVTHGSPQQALQHGLRQAVLFGTQPASAGHRFAHVKAVGQVAIEHRAEAQFEHEQGMLLQKAAQLGAGDQAFLDCEQEGFHIRALGMGPLAGLGGVDGGVRNHTPIEQGKVGAIALHQRIMLHEQAHGPLVKGLRCWYNHDRLLAGHQVNDFFLLCLQVVPLSSPAHHRSLVRN